MNTADNRRVQYTKRVIKESFLSLLLTKPAGSITVTEICREADVNRTTFYTHYDDVYDLKRKIEDEFYNTLVASIERYFNNGAEYASMIPVYETIAKNETLCEAIFGRFGDDAFLKRCCDIQKEQMVVFLKRQFPLESKQTLETTRCYIMNGCMGIIKNWVYGGMKGDPVQLAQLADRLSAQTLRALTDHLRPLGARAENTLKLS